SAACSYGNRNSTASKPASAAAAKRSRKGNSVNRKLRFAARRGIGRSHISIAFGQRRRHQGEGNRPPEPCSNEHLSEGGASHSSCYFRVRNMFSPSLSNTVSDS